MIPHLKGNPLVAVVGPEAGLVTARLGVTAAQDGLRLVQFGHNAFVPPDQYAQIIRAAGRTLGQISVFVTTDGDPAITDRADLIILAPEGVGNRVWLVPRDGQAFSICLPAYGERACVLITELLLQRRIRLFDEHLARPRVQLLPLFDERQQAVCSRQPTHPGPATVH
jgi:hypothetical protein